MASQNKRIGERIYQMRHLRGWTQENLAEMVDCSLQFLGMVENGKRGVSLHTLCLLANTLRISTDDLLGLASVPVSAADQGFELLLQDCSERERRIMLDVAETVKLALRKNI